MTSCICTKTIMHATFRKENIFLQVRMKSYASRAQLAVTQAEIDAAMELEWDRRLITVLGSANNRLYEFRLQTANSTYEASKVRRPAARPHCAACCSFCSMGAASLQLQHANATLQLCVCIITCVSITMLIIVQQTCIGSCIMLCMLLQTFTEMH
jgi:hypothetical protein